MGQRTAQSATVDVLTAEVRVLMVGSRQVTMSVYKQLDDIEYRDVRPFGRVNPTDAEANYVYVVGVDAGGALARAKVYRHTSYTPEALRTFVAGASKFTEATARLQWASYWVRRLPCSVGTKDELLKRLIVAVGEVYSGPDSHFADVAKRGYSASFLSSCEGAPPRPVNPSYGDAEALPLIVLAGLR